MLAMKMKTKSGTFVFVLKKCAKLPKLYKIRYTKIWVVDLYLEGPHFQHLLKPKTSFPL